VTKKQTAEVDVKPDVKKAKKKKEREPRELRHYPLSPISVPLANDEDQVALFKLLEAAAKAKNVRRGVKEIQKAIRKKETGLMIFAGDVEPVDVISHLPVLCEDNNVPYIFVRSKEELGAASSTKRPTSCILVKENSDYKKLYQDCKKRIKPVIY
jgi:ribosomal protein L7Ae-like RNA K-turn-binding protein